MSYGKVDTVIQLHGGPKDGEWFTIDSDMEKFGMFKVAVMKEFNPMELYMRGETIPPVMTVPVEKHVYIRRTVCAGKIGSCEYREWKEWHYDGRL